MVKSYRLEKQGSLSDLKLISHDLPLPKSTEVRIKHKFIGINRFDLHHVLGDYKMAKLPDITGIEGYGIITHVGDKVKDFKKDDEVMYLSGLRGSFSEERNIDERYVMIANKHIDGDIQLAMLSGGLTSQLLSKQVYFARPVSNVVVYGAAGGVGYLLCQSLKNAGAKVIAVVGSEEKAAFVNKLGPDHVINHSNEDLVKKIREYTGGLGANCIYDCYGKGFLPKTLSSVAPFGMVVNYGDVHGVVDGLNVVNMWQRSVFFVGLIYLHIKPPIGLSLSYHQRCY